MSDLRDGDDDPATSGSDVMAAVDCSTSESLFVIADVSTEDAWIATPTAEARLLAACR